MLKPFRTHLTILQQEGYSISRFLSWWLSHPLTYSLSSKKGLVKTSKTGLITKLSLLYLALINFSLFYSGQLLLLLILDMVLLLAPFPLLFLSILSLIPYEKINRYLTVERVRSAITSHSKLDVIGITGSYGKTSVKDFLCTILQPYAPTVKTPESYNTVFGIAKVVDLELLSKTRYFICEMGAYIRGEIRELTRMVPPQYAILTAIGSQHLERFKYLTNTTLAKFELIEAVKPSHALVNWDNPYIKEHLSLSKHKGTLTYSLTDPQATFYTHSHKLTPSGFSFSITHQGKSLSFNSSLFGTSNLYNLTSAISMAIILKVPYRIIKDQVAKIKSSPHRLELKRFGKAILIDNAYSSNEEGFTSLINDLSKIKGKKVLITPGIVELGKQTAPVHQKIGALCSGVFDKVILVGRSERTNNLERGITGKLKHNLSYIENSTNLWPLVEDLSKTYDWILIENDLPDTF